MADRALKSSYQPTPKYLRPQHPPRKRLTDLEDVPAGGVPLIHVHRRAEQRPCPQAVDLLQGRVPVPSAGVGRRGDGPSPYPFHQLPEAPQGVEAVEVPRGHTAVVEGSSLAFCLSMQGLVRVCAGEFRWNKNIDIFFEDVPSVKFMYNIHVDSHTG